MEVKKQYNDIFAVLKENKSVNLEILYPVKISLKSERKIETLSPPKNKIKCICLEIGNV